MCDDVQLCNRCVPEFLILARTWFTFGLPSKTGCDIRPQVASSGAPLPHLSCLGWPSIEVPFSRRRALGQHAIKAYHHAHPAFVLSKCHT
jgi:hypothetical protein